MLQLIDEDNCLPFEHLFQEYEKEFAFLIGDESILDGKGENWHAPNKGFYWIEDSKIVGFCIKGTMDGRSDIAEFYIVPPYRKKGVGTKFAHEIFNLFPGPWQIRQLLTAVHATIFWRLVINEYTNGNYSEQVIDDVTWGKVICQRFTSPGIK